MQDKHVGHFFALVGESANLALIVGPTNMDLIYSDKQDLSWFLRSVLEVYVHWWDNELPSITRLT